MSWLISLIVAILKAVLPWLFERSKPTAEESKRQPELRNRLQKRIRRKFGPVVLLCLLPLFCMGCGSFTRTIYIPPGEPVQLRQTIKGVKIWTVDQDGKKVAGKVDLPEGWYALPDAGPES